jgi:hypothetical protein
MSVKYLFQTTMKYVKIFTIKGPRKLIQIGILGLKRSHLTTLTFQLNTLSIKLERIWTKM